MFITENKEFIENWYNFLKNLAALRRIQDDPSKAEERAQYQEIISISFIAALTAVLRSIENVDTYSVDSLRWLTSQKDIVIYHLTQDVSVDIREGESLLSRIENVTMCKPKQHFIINTEQFAHVLGSLSKKYRPRITSHAVALFHPVLTYAAEEYNTYLGYRGMIENWHTQLEGIVRTPEEKLTLQNDWQTFTASIKLEETLINQTGDSIQKKLDQITEIRNRTLLEMIRAELTDTLNRLQNLLSRALERTFQVVRFVTEPIVHPIETFYNISYVFTHPKASWAALVKYATEHPIKTILIGFGIIGVPILSFYAAGAFAAAVVPAGMAAFTTIDEIIVITGLTVGFTTAVLTAGSTAARIGEGAKAMVAYDAEKQKERDDNLVREQLVQHRAKITGEDFEHIREQQAAAKRAIKETRREQLIRDQQKWRDQSKQQIYQNIEERMRKGQVTADQIRDTIQEIENKKEEVETEIKKTDRDAAKAQGVYESAKSQTEEALKQQKAAEELSRYLFKQSGIGINLSFFTSEQRYCYEGQHIHAALLGRIEGNPQVRIFRTQLTEKLFLDCFDQQVDVAQLSQEGYLNIVIMQIRTNHWMSLLFDNRQGAPRVVYIDPTGERISDTLGTHIMRVFPGTNILCCNIAFQTTGLCVNREAASEYIHGDVVNCGVWVVKLVDLYMQLGRLPTEADLCEDCGRFDINEERARQQPLISRHMVNVLKLEEDTMDEMEVDDTTTATMKTK